MMMEYTESDIKRFWSKVDIRQEDECWPWLASLKGGYGQFNYGGGLNQRKLISSRVAYELINGNIPDGKSVLHKCDNPACVNPKHLFIGTHEDNMNDMKQKGRSVRVDGHAKLTFEIAERIRADDRSYKMLSEAYGVSKSTISYIKNNKSWKASERS